MDSKDNRFKDKKSKMKQHYSAHPPKYYQRGGGTVGANHTSSSSPQADGGVHSIVDVADSSDEPRFARGKGWSGRKPPPPQPNRERLDLTHNERDEDLYANDAACNDKENAQLCAGNFTQMANHVTHTGHFAFDDEKHWNASLITGENEQKIIDANEYFTLNFKMLNAGLQSIPFYKRMDYSASLFTRDQLNAMNQAAEIIEKDYQREFGKKPSLQVNSASQRSGNNNKDKDELDELLELTADQVNKVSLAGNIGAGGGTPNTVAPSTPAAATATAGDTKDDVQNWLDSVLEE